MNYNYLPVSEINDPSLEDKLKENIHLGQSE